MRSLFLLLLLVTGPLMAETGYRYVHPDGTVEFSDTPIEGGEEIKLRKAPAIQFAPVTPAPTSPAQPTSRPQQKTPTAQQSITITSPQPNQTMRFDGSDVMVSVALGDTLQQGEKVVITLDGSVVASGSGTSFNIGQVYRGSHTLAAHIESSDGSRIVSSQPITFHVLQRSIQHPGQQPEGEAVDNGGVTDPH